MKIDTERNGLESIHVFLYMITENWFYSFSVAEIDFEIQKEEEITKMVGP